MNPDEEHLLLIDIAKRCVQLKVNLINLRYRDIIVVNTVELDILDDIYSKIAEAMPS